MLKFFNKVLYTFFFLSVGSWAPEEATFEDQKKALMIQDLEVIKHHFEVGYAPADWKKEHRGFDLNQSFENAKNQTQARWARSKNAPLCYVPPSPSKNFTLGRVNSKFWVVVQHPEGL